MSGYSESRSASAARQREDDFAESARNLARGEVGRIDGVRFIESIPGVRQAIGNCLDGCRWAYALRNAPHIVEKRPEYVAAERVGAWLATGRAQVNSQKGIA